MKYVFTRNAVFSALLVGTALMAPGSAHSSPTWPWQCGPINMNHEYEVVKYLRFYPSKETAMRQSVLTKDDQPPGGKFDSHDILTGFVVKDNSGQTYRHIVYADQIPDNPKQPVSIVVPIYFPANVVDTEDAKLRNAHGSYVRLFDPSDAGNVEFPRGGSMNEGATNYPCVVKFDDSKKSHTLAYIQGYVWRENLGDYFKLVQ